MFKHPADFRRNMCFHGFAAIPLIGPLLAGGQTQQAPAAVAPAPVPTVDSASVAVQQQQQSDQTQAQKKGALSTLLNDSNTSTGDSLGAGSPETTLKRFLG